VVAPPSAPSRAPREDRTAAASVVVPDESPRAFDDLGDLLTEVPGVTVTRSGGIGDFATVSLRGSNPEQVRIYLDGVPLNLAAGGAIDISTLPIGDVERIEIYRGSTPIAFAESALGGVIAIETRAPDGRQPRVTARAGGGSFGTMFGDVTAAGKLGPLRVYGGAHALSGRDGYTYHSDNGTTADPSDDYDTTRANNDLAQVDGVLRASLPLGGRRELGVGLIGIARDQGLPGNGLISTRQSRFQTARGVAYARYRSRDDLGPGGQLDAQLFLSAVRDRFSDPLGEIGTLKALTSDTTVSAGASASASRPLSGWARVTAIAEGRHETFQPTNQADPMPVGVPAERWVGVAGAQLDLWWRRIDLDVIPSARVEAMRDQITGRDFLFGRQIETPVPSSRALPIARLGLARPLSPSVTLKANAGRYARAPSFFELYGDTGLQIGNPTLKPETGWSGDVGASYQLAGGGALALDGRTTLFGALVDDLIDWMPSNVGPSRVGNIDRARVSGVEQDGVVAIGRRLRVVLQATYLEARDDGSILARKGRLLPLRPRWHAYARPELRRALPRRGIAATVFVEGDLRTGGYTDPANVVVQPSRLLLGAGAALEIPRAGLRFTLSGKNLTDSRLLDLKEYPLPGRSVFLSLMWSSRLDETSKEPLP
jgi:iron complex outermembrane receptor protein